jgi:hypothetical protein
MFVVDTSKDIQRLDTRHWLDEIDTATVYSKTILLSSIDLKSHGDTEIIEKEPDDDQDLYTGM